MAAVHQPGLFGYLVRTAGKEKLCGLHIPLSVESHLRSVYAERKVRERPCVVPRGHQRQRRAGADAERIEGESDRFVLGSRKCGEERTLAIWVNGSDTGKSVRQEANPATNAFSVTWSEGCLTVVDGAYTFAEPKERGMYFKWKSKYGIKFEGTVSSSTKYQSVVYGLGE